MEQRKMSANDTIWHMIHAMNQDRRDLFYGAAESFTTNTVKGKSFIKFRTLLNNKPAVFKEFKKLSENLNKLVEASNGNVDNVFVNDSVNELVEELIIEWNNKDIYASHNLKVRNKILFYGPTGNGKTTIARYIAKKSGLPFFEIKADTIIDSHIGSSGANIYTVFKELNYPCIIFWDEIDTIGIKRSNGSSAASQENDRMTNSMLINIDKMSDDVIFIGATNRYEHLDSAFVRRFDIKYELAAPSQEEKVNFCQQLIDWYNIDQIMPLHLNSYSEISKHLADEARKIVLAKIKKDYVH